MPSFSTSLGPSTSTCRPCALASLLRLLAQAGRRGVVGRQVAEFAGELDAGGRGLGRARKRPCSGAASATR